MDSSERNILKNIYKIIISSMLLIPLLFPITMLISHQFIYPIIILLLIINITLWAKYYTFNNYDNFQMHIKELLRSFIRSGIVLIMLLLPELTDQNEKKYITEFSFLFSWLYYVFKIFKGYSILNEKNERPLQEINQHECLNNIYLMLFILLLITPVAMFIYWPFSFLYVLIINILIFEKYYKYNESNFFQAHIKSIFLTSIVMTCIFVIPLTINIQEAHRLNGDLAIGAGLNIIGLTLLYLIIYYYTLKRGHKEISD